MYEQWNKYAENSGIFTPEEFEQAAYRLITEQVIYESDHGNKNCFRLIESFERPLGGVLEPLGVKLEINRRHRYAVALPIHSRQGSVSPKLTILALVLLKLYHLGAQRGGFTDTAEIECDLPQLQQIFLDVTGQELPNKTDLDDALRTFRRWGIARKVDGEADDLTGQQPFTIMIRPAIYEVLGTVALERLACQSLLLSSDADASYEGDDVINKTESTTKYVEQGVNHEAA